MPPIDLPASEPAPETVAAAPVVVETPAAAPPAERRNSMLDKIFHPETGGLGEPEPAAKTDDEPAPEPAKKKAATKQAKAKEPENEDADTDDEGDEEDEDPDFDAPIAEETPAETGDEPEPEPENETMARKMAKENGKRAKKAEAALSVVEVERDREKERADKLEKKVKELEVTKIKPQDHPDYQRMRGEVMDNVENQADLITDAKDIPKHFGAFVGQFLDIKKLPRAEQAAAKDALKQEIFSRCSKFGDEYENLLPDEQKEADRMVAQVLQVVVQNAPKSQEVLDFAAKLAEDSEFGMTAIRERDYKETVGRIQPDLDVLGDLDDATIQENPHSIEAIIAEMVKKSPAARERADKAKDLIRDVIAGPRPLTAKEIEKLKANGTNMKDFEAARQEKHAAKVKKAITLMFRGAMAHAAVGDKLKEYHQLKGDADLDADEDAVLRKTVKKAKADPTPKVIRPSERKNFGLGRIASL